MNLIAGDCVLAPSRGSAIQKRRELLNCFDRNIRIMCGNYLCVNPDHIAVSGGDRYMLFSLYQKCVQNGECLEWKGATDKRGYPVIRHREKLKRPRRLMYELLNGDIDENIQIIGTCKNPNCIHPDHITTRVQENKNEYG